MNEVDRMRMTVTEHPWHEGMPRADMIDEIETLRRTCESWSGTADMLLHQRDAARRELEGAVAALRAKLDEMEVHDDLPDSFALGYIAAWSEFRKALDALGGQ